MGNLLDRCEGWLCSVIVDKKTDISDHTTKTFSMFQSELADT